MHITSHLVKPPVLSYLLQPLPRQLHRCTTVVVTAIFVSLLAACGGSSGSSSGVASATIDTQGGTLVGPDGVRVVIPAGALDQSTTIGIAISSTGAPDLPADAAPGTIYEFTPHDVVFNKPVTLRMPVPVGADGTEILIASPGGEWQAYEATVTGGFAEWQRNSFSWGLIAGCAPENNPPYSSSNPDPYPCSWPRGAADATATPAQAITRITYGSNYTNGSGSAGSWAVTEAGTVHLTLNYQAAPDCENGHVKLIRWDPAAPLATPNRVTTLFDQAVPLTQTTFTIQGVGSYVKATGSTTIDVAFSHLDNNTLGSNGSQGTHAFGYSFSCNRPFRNAMSGGDLLTIVSSIPVPSVTHSIGGTVSGLTGTGLVLQNNGINFTPVSADGSFTFSSSLGAGALYNVSVLTQPAGQTCTVSNGSGTANADISNVDVNCISTYSIGGAVSGLVGTGLVLQNNGADDLTFTNSGAFSFVTRLAAGATYTVTVKTQPSGSNCIVQSGSAGTANADVTDVVVVCTSTGALALVANSGTSNGVNGLSVYRVDPSTGVLSFLSNVTAGNYPYAVAVTPNGLYAYVTNLVGGTISSYSIDSASGALSLIPLSSPGTNNPYGIAMDRLGRFIWVANYGFHTLSAFVIGPNGVLAASGSPLSTASLPIAIAAHPATDFIYVAHDSTSITAYSVNPASGALTLLQTLSNAITSPRGFTIDPSGRFLYVTSVNGGISAYSINSGTGQLTSIGSVSSGNATNSVVVHPNGLYLYVANRSGSNNVLVFSINQTTGALTQTGSPYSAGNNPSSVSVNATGTHLYVTNLTGNNVSAFAIGGGGGTLTSLGAAVSAGSAPEGIAVTP